ncbi:MAG: ADP-dependent glucokinase/phosphofructokinase [Candidatus Micrarchaeia archaeon]
MNAVERWNGELARSRSLAPLGLSVLCAFNSVVDRVKRVRRADLAALEASLSPVERARARGLAERDYFPLGSVDSPWEAFACLSWSMSRGEAAYASISPAASAWLARALGAGNWCERLGGQASLMAENLAELGCSSAVYPVLLSRKLARLHSTKISYPVARGKGARLVSVRGESNAPKAKENLVLEYGGDASARANRVIFSSRSRRTLAFDKSWNRDSLVELGGLLDACIFSGFHYAPNKRELAPVLGQLDALKQGRGRFEFHCEYVPFKHKAAEAPVMREVCSRMDSLGLNEVELRELHKSLYGSGFDYSSPRALSKAAGKVRRTLGLKRVHVHDLGFHVVSLDRELDPKRCVSACLLASDRANAKASAERERAPRVTAYSLGKMHEYSNDRDYLRCGFVEERDGYAVVAPAPFLAKPRHTLGLGDVVSSTAFVAELAGR